MENTRGEQSSENNISGRKQPHAAAPDPPISAGHTGQNSFASPTGPTGCNTPTGPTIPTSCAAPTDHVTLTEPIIFAGSSTPNCRWMAETTSRIAMSFVEMFKDVVDEDLRAFLRQQLHTMRSIIEDLREPINDDSIFAAFDGEQPQQQVEASPVPDGALEQSNHALTKRA